MHLKPLALSLLLATSHQASAESFLLYSHGAWEVRYEDGEAGVRCSASVADDGLYFSIDVLKGYGLDAWFISSQNNFGEAVQTGQVVLQIDGRQAWETPATAQTDTVRMTGLAEGFLIDVMEGRKLFIDDDYDGQWDAWFSLNGSRAAMMALADCNKKLGNLS